MRLSRNKLTGSIPQVFASLTKLQVLGLGHNQLQGLLPAELVSLRQLAVLDVSNNMLNGTMPTSWRLMAGPGFKLQCLLLYNNVELLNTDEDVCELTSRSEARVPWTGLAFNDPNNALCMNY